MVFHVSTQSVAFIGNRLLSFGRLDLVVDAAKQAFDIDTAASALIFDATTSVRIDVDLGGSAADVQRRIPLAPFAPMRGPGRPKLGVIPREVTLLPRHWEWLSAQPGGASVALRKLVEQARKGASCADDVRMARDATYKFMTAIGGDYIGYEEATRALFAGDGTKFTRLIEDWPPDVYTHIMHLANSAFTAEHISV